MCCTSFAHKCTLATWAYVLETVHGAVRRLWTFCNAPLNVNILSLSFRAPTNKMRKFLKAASCRWTKSERGIFTQKTMATGWTREISYRSAKMRCKILSSARGCSLLAVCVNLSCLFKNKLGLIFFSRISWVFFADSETSFSRKSEKPRENGSPDHNYYYYYYTCKRTPRTTHHLIGQRPPCDAL